MTNKGKGQLTRFLYGVCAQKAHLRPIIISVRYPLAIRLDHTVLVERLDMVVRDDAIICANRFFVYKTKVLGAFLVRTKSTNHIEKFNNSCLQLPTWTLIRQYMKNGHNAEQSQEGVYVAFKRVIPFLPF